MFYVNVLSFNTLLFVQDCSVLSHAALVCRKDIKPAHSNSAKNLIYLPLGFHNPGLYYNYSYKDYC